MSQGQGAREKKVTQVKPSVSEPLNVGEHVFSKETAVVRLSKKAGCVLSLPEGGT